MAELPSAEEMVVIPGLWPCAGRSAIERGLHTGTGMFSVPCHACIAAVTVDANAVLRQADCLLISCPQWSFRLLKKGLSYLVFGKVETEYILNKNHAFINYIQACLCNIVHASALHLNPCSGQATSQVRFMTPILPCELMPARLLNASQVLILTHVRCPHLRSTSQ